jgi:hypothetical protein
MLQVGRKIKVCDATPIWRNRFNEAPATYGSFSASAFCDLAHVVNFIAVILQTSPIISYWLITLF